MTVSLSANLVKTNGYNGRKLNANYFWGSLIHVVPTGNLRMRGYACICTINSTIKAPFSCLANCQKNQSNFITRLLLGIINNSSSSSSIKTITTIQSHVFIAECTVRERVKITQTKIFLLLSNTCAAAAAITTTKTTIDVDDEQTYSH